jgi:hypothetical protein
VTVLGKRVRVLGASEAESASSQEGTPAYLPKYRGYVVPRLRRM